MYIDPHTEFRYDNDEQQAKWTLLGLGIASVLLCLWMIAIVKHLPYVG